MRGMTGWIVPAFLCGLIAGSAGAQQCALDLNGDNQTTIDELIVAINQALEGCGEPTTGTCPFTFDDDNFGGDFCFYVGDLSSSCFGTETAGGSWASDGSMVIAVVSDSSGALGYSA